ncbi:hypothetical protein SAMN04488523_104342 [Sulfitobacter brevis]|uniref:Uncharacterized protein n=1 Tax=Sulfitobacter brevis TaxID=74348 RepID=A0A1I1XDZ0_9RHOB|nr:hypothetical protein SAMN04488523_104342 [Sulfitobacter brevis]
MTEEEFELHRALQTDRPDLRRPIELIRKIPLSWLYSNLSVAQFDKVIIALKEGCIVRSYD